MPQARTSLQARIEYIPDPGTRTDLPVEKGRTPRDYEYQIITVPRGSSISAVRNELTEHAEYGHWNLARTRSYYGGGKKVWMRRRIQRMSSTFAYDEF